MNRLKHIFVLAVVIVLLILNTITTFATDDMESKISEIYDYFSESISTYGLYGVPEIQPPVDGEVHLSYTSDSIQEYEDTLRYTNNLIDAYYQNERQVSLQELDDCMSSMLEAEKCLTLERENLSFLLDICVEENNSNNYYSSGVWNKFTESVAKAQAIIQDETIIDLRVNDAY
ncbi:MAG: hypothetical protein ACI4GZ_02315 [Ruminococcus sp.]